MPKLLIKWLITALFLFIVCMIIVRVFQSVPRDRSDPGDFKLAIPESALSVEKTVMLSGVEDERLPGMVGLMENNRLRLFMQMSTAEMAVVDKASDTIWYSNPQNTDEDPLATPNIKDKLLSQLTLSYLMPNGQLKDYNSYRDSVAFPGQMQVITQEDSIQVVYRFGNPEKGIEVTPLRISASRFEEVLLGKLADEADREVLITRYRFIEAEEVYERRDIPKTVIKRFVAIFEKAGYTEEDLAIDHAETGVVDEGAGSNPFFQVSLAYRLEGDNLLVSLDAGENVSDNPAYKIQGIGILENFGAANMQEEGYMFLPDGSGTIVNFNNNTALAQAIVLPLYGEDQAYMARERLVMPEASRMPVFGIKKSDTAMFAIIEQGDSIARIAAETSGKQHAYNLIGPRFQLHAREYVRLSNNEQMIRKAQQSYRGKLQIRYAFLQDNEASYSGMANYYRQYLIDFYGLQPLAAGGEIPFYLEMVASIRKERNLFGYSYEQQLPLSTYEDVSLVLDQLGEQGVTNVHLNYKGWQGGGVAHDFPVKTKLAGNVASIKDWHELERRLEAAGGGLYPDVALMQVLRPGNGFSSTRDAVQLLSRKYAVQYAFNPATFQKDYSRFSHYVLSPGQLESVVSRFLSSSQPYRTGKLSLRDLGNTLSSDFRVDAEWTREEAKAAVIHQAMRLNETEETLMANGGNSYLLPYVTHVIEAPQGSNNYQSADRAVPFYQMVLHGYISYAGKPFNTALDQNARLQVLQALETGSNVYYSWIGKEPSILQGTNYEYLYAHYYKNWLQEAAEVYGEINVLLKQVQNATIVSHEKVASEAYQTLYSNGAKATVNYSDKAIQHDGKTIAPMSYIWEEASE